MKALWVCMRICYRRFGGFDTQSHLKTRTAPTAKAKGPGQPMPSIHQHCGKPDHTCQTLRFLADPSIG